MYFVFRILTYLYFIHNIYYYSHANRKRKKPLQTGGGIKVKLISPAIPSKQLIFELTFEQEY